MLMPTNSKLLMHVLTLVYKLDFCRTIAPRKSFNNVTFNSYIANIIKFNDRLTINNHVIFT